MPARAFPPRPLPLLPSRAGFTARVGGLASHCEQRTPGEPGHPRGWEILGTAHEIKGEREFHGTVVGLGETMAVV